MAHLHTLAGQHDLTVSAFVVRTDGVPRVLMHRHKIQGVWMQPGGHVELDEDPWTALTRELVEETGYAPGQLRVLQPVLRAPKLTDAVVHPQPVCVSTHLFGHVGDHWHTDITYALSADADPAGAPGAGESEELRWFTRDELAALPDGQTHPNVRELGLFVLDRVSGDWEGVEWSLF